MQYAFNFTYHNHALLSYQSALGIYRDSNNLSFEDATAITNKIEESLSNADVLVLESSSDSTIDLVPVLHSLREQIISTPTSLKKQLLRLFYNITDVTMKLVEELERIKKEG